MLAFRFIVVALAAGIMIVGAALLPGMRTDILPETSPTVVQIQTEAPGLSAPEVESLVTTPLEKNLLEGILGVTDVTSDSLPGLSSIDLHFTPGTGLYQARQLVQERLTQAFVLPNVSLPPVMRQPISSTGDVMIVGLTSTGLSQIQLSVLARWTIVPRLLGVAGVAEVSTFGQADRQLQVLVNPSVLAAHHISVAQSIDTAGNSQLVTPLSFLEGSTPGTGGFLESPNQRITIRHILPFGTPANLGQVPVTDVRGRQVLLGNVATIVQGNQPLIGDGQVRGGPGLLLMIEKLPSASVPAVTRGLGQALAGLKPALAGVHVDAALFRPATYLASAVRNVRLALIVAAALAVVALIALLLNIRLAFLALAGMALSLVAATLVLYLLGYTFNSLVLLGLLLALAVVVDDAAGGAYRLMQQLGADRVNGHGPPIASLARAAYRDFLGVLGTSTLTSVLVVAPLFFASGLTATFLRPMVLAFALAAAASLAVALTVSPALAAVLFAVRNRRPRGLVLGRWFGPDYARVVRGTRHLPAWALLVLGAAALGGLAAAAPILHPGQPAFTDRSLVVRWTGAPGMSLPELDRITTLATRELMALPGVQDVGATLGRAVSSEQEVNTNSGTIWITIKPSADYGQEVAAVRAVVSGTPGMQGTVSTFESDSMAGVLSAPARTVSVRVYGPDLAELSRLASQVKSIMSGIPGLRQPQVQLPVEQPAINVRVDILKARLHGLAPGDVRREAGTLINGLTVGNFFQQQKVFDVVVWGVPAVRSSLTSVDNLLIDSANGGQVRLGDIAQVTMSQQPLDIQHQAMSRYLDVTARLSGGSAGKAGAVIASGLRAVSFPLGYHPEFFGSLSGNGTSRPMFASYVAAALLGIVLLVQAALGSWRLAALALAATLLPLAGAAATAVGIGPTSLGAAAGLLAVLAIALRQAIAVTARIRRRHTAEGGALTVDLVVAAARDSAGPLAASALVTAVMLAPFLVMGDVAGNEMTRSAAAVILVGLAIATLFNLFLLPAAYLAAGPPSAVTAYEQETEGGERDRVATAPGPQG